MKEQIHTEANDIANKEFGDDYVRAQFLLRTYAHALETCGCGSCERDYFTVRAELSDSWQKPLDEQFIKQ